MQRTSPVRQNRPDAPAVPHVRVPTALLLDETVPAGAVRLWALLDNRLRANPSEVFTASQLGTLMLVSRATAERWAGALEAAGWLARGTQVGQHRGVAYELLRRARALKSATPGPREVSQICDASAGVHRTERAGWGEEEQGPAASPAVRPWCGRCDSSGYRFLVDDDGNNPRRCPTCHPASLLPAPF